MFDPAQVPPVDSVEILARYILSSSHFRKSDQTVKPDAFMPHPRVELSLTRHREATIEELWREGERVAAIRKLTLYGRADVTCSAFLEQSLKVEAIPLADNPNHADAIEWPAEKASQKMKALEIAKRAQMRFI
ncbi:hypothetical protein KIH39_25880 [Telmatocola sphagniphila]|uniref:Uncharacterized protein n=1 Tax=Telmatocola sphagniphila TaxID=1123043 RepID=A0A8E6ETB2_9BACT|nr:hypothetical protein [Telmatocola sphagniphila]QVL32224.1 hypothetical protein KIH39_25880 [Telmatocola sphagniphila]